jgi:predicted nucleic acid-binding protein
VQAKQAGLIPAVRPLLEEIRRAGYYLSDALIEVAAKLAGEAEP